MSGSDFCNDFHQQIKKRFSKALNTLRPILLMEKPSHRQWNHSLQTLQQTSIMLRIESMSWESHYSLVHASTNTSGLIYQGADYLQFLLISTKVLNAQYLKKNKPSLAKNACSSLYFDMEGCVPFMEQLCFFCKWLNIESVHTRDGWNLYAYAVIPIVKSRKALWEVVKILDPLSRNEVI